MFPNACLLPQQALRVLAVHLCYRNELVEDPALFQTAAPRVSARYGCHKFVPCRHAHLPHIRLCPLTPKRSKSDEATGLYSAAFQARQCALLKWSLASLAAAYVLTVVGLAAFQRRLQYFPDRRLTELALGGRPAANFARRMMLPVSNDTLLRVVRRRASLPSEPLAVIGIDDWAWRRNHRYGTIVCDLERRRTVTLLPDREQATAQAWLAGHPDVTVVARDRGGG